MLDIGRSIVEPTAEPPYERPNQGIAQGITRDIDGRPTVGGDEDRIDRAVAVSAKGGRCQVCLVRLLEADPPARGFHHVTVARAT
jgi:hypothetical protein